MDSCFFSLIWWFRWLQVQNPSPTVSTTWLLQQTIVESMSFWTYRRMPVPAWDLLVVFWSKKSWQFSWCPMHQISIFFLAILRFVTFFFDGYRRDPWKRVKWRPTRGQRLTKRSRSVTWLVYNYKHMGVSKNRGTPKMDGLYWKTL